MANETREFRKYVRSASLYFGLLALFIVGSILSGEFLTIDNQRDVLWQVSNVGILAIGMTLVILTAGIDLSVGSLLSVGTVICAMLLMNRDWTPASSLALPVFALIVACSGGWLTRVFARRRSRSRKTPMTAGATSPPSFSGPMATALPFVVGLACGAGALLWSVSRVSHGFGVVAVLLIVPPFGLLLGAINGTIIAKGRLQPFIVTLAMMISAVGLAKWIAGSGGRVHPIYMGDAAREAVAPRSFEFLAANIPVLGKDLIPVPGLFFIFMALVAAFILNYLPIGRHILAVGGNEETARLSGINTDRVKIFVYSASGFLSCLAAVLYCAQYQQGKADAGFTRELDAIAAVVIGGTSLMGGRGNISGTVVGVFIFGYLGNILNLRGVSTEFQSIMKGLIIVLAVLLQEGILSRWIVDGYRRLRSG